MTSRECDEMHLAYVENYKKYQSDYQELELERGRELEEEYASYFGEARLPIGGGDDTQRG